MTKIERHDGFFLLVVEGKEGGDERLTTNTTCEESVHLARQSSEDLAGGRLMPITVARLQRQLHRHHGCRHRERGRDSVARYVADDEKVAAVTGRQEIVEVT